MGIKGTNNIKLINRGSKTLNITSQVVPKEQPKVSTMKGKITIFLKKMMVDLSEDLSRVAIVENERYMPKYHTHGGVEYIKIPSREIFTAPPIERILKDYAYTKGYFLEYNGYDKDKMIFTELRDVDEYIEEWGDYKEIVKKFTPYLNVTRQERILRGEYLEEQIQPKLISSLLKKAGCETAMILHSIETSILNKMPYKQEWHDGFDKKHTIQIEAGYLPGTLNATYTIDDYSTTTTYTFINPKKVL